MAYMADGQLSAFGTSRHPGSETSVGLPGEQKLYLRRGHMRSRPHYDASWKDLLKAAQQCMTPTLDRASLIAHLVNLWTNTHNPNPVLPCLTVRTALDLFLTVQRYPPDSEVIVSAINIPDMIYILHQHRLKVVTLDVDLETLAPKIELLEGLLTPKTVALMVSHLFGNTFDMGPFVKAATKHKLALIEDAAEAFCSFDRIGHPGADLSLFSFGPIKFYTAFGGAIAKIKNVDLYEKMKRLYGTYPTQSHLEYFRKIVKYSLVYLCINCPRFMKPSLFVLRALGIELRNNIVTLLRGFPDQLMYRMRHQPSAALLHMMCRRMNDVSTANKFLSGIKADYVSERMPKNVTLIGTRADVKGYWLYPILVEYPDQVARTLYELGIEAFRGATQLNVVESDNSPKNGLRAYITKYPHEARFIINHILYLPVNKTLPFFELDKICVAVDIAVRASSNGTDFVPSSRLRPNVRHQSKL